MKRISLFLFLMIFALFSCRDEVVNTDTTTIPLGTETNYNQNVYGQILTQAGEPISGATVRIDNDVKLTDENGTFLFENVEAGNYGKQISATMDGFLYGGYRLYVNEEGTSHVEIVLMDLIDFGSVNAQGGTINVSTNGSISFPADAFTQNGSAYQGNVSVKGNWIDPTSDDLLRLNPGDLSGLNVDGERVQLGSFGMIGVELIGDNGQEVQIADGKEVEMTFEIPDAMVAQAPATIPLWSFDEEAGLWIEESVATLTGNVYVGNVTHFSWWNTDFINPVVQFCLLLVDGNNQPLFNTRVNIKSLSGFGCAWGYTDNRGILCGLVPENTELQITIDVDPAFCQDDFIVEVVGPYTQAQSPVFETIVVNFDNTVFTNTVSGVISDCSGSPVPNTVVKFTYNNASISTITDSQGAYSQDIIACEVISVLDIFAFSVDAELQGSGTLNDLNGGTYSADISMCDVFVETLILFSDPSTTLIVNFVDAKVKPFETILTSDENGLHIMGFDCMGVGNCTGNYTGAIGDFSLDIDVTVFGAVGQTIEGSFVATDLQGVQTYMGSFKALRVE